MVMLFQENFQTFCKHRFLMTEIALQMGRLAELHLAVREEILNYLKANPVSSVLVKL